uniref:Uncharacterized protein n=1 Tax=Panagrolaimus superbus TaxID=310955 RepID=A0A914YWY8_9BILA
MLLSSIFLWFNISSIIVLSLFKSKSHISNHNNVNLIKSALIQLSLIFGITLTLTNLIKIGFKIDADSHIWTFVKAKLGLPIDALPFETALYICHGAFAFIDNGFFDRTTTFGMLPLYCIVVAIVVGFVLKYLFLNYYFGAKQLSLETKIVPEQQNEFFNESIIFLIGQSILTGIMAILTLRMKYVWFPQIAIIASHGLKIFDKWIGKYPKYVVMIGIIWLISTKQFEIYQQQIANEQVCKKKGEGICIN